MITSNSTRTPYPYETPIYTLTYICTSNDKCHQKHCLTRVNSCSHLLFIYSLSVSLNQCYDMPMIQCCSLSSLYNKPLSQNRLAKQFKLRDKNSILHIFLLLLQRKQTKKFSVRFPPYLSNYYCCCFHFLTCHFPTFFPQEEKQCGQQLIRRRIEKRQIIIVIHI